MGIVAPARNPGVWEVEAGLEFKHHLDYEFGASLVYNTELQGSQSYTVRHPV